MAGLLTLQGKIVATGTAQQLPSNPGQFKSAILTAKGANTAPIAVTVSSTGGVVDGTGTGYILEAGKSLPLDGLNDTDTIWLTGTANDVYSLGAIN